MKAKVEIKVQITKAIKKEKNDAIKSLKKFEEKIKKL